MLFTKCNEVFSTLFEIDNLLPLLHRDVYRPGRPQGQVMDRIRFDGLARNQGKAGALGDGGEQQVALHHGEVETDTDARTRTERHKSIAGKLFLPFGRETLRIKLFRFWEVFLASVQGIRSKQHYRTFGDAIAINLDIAQGTPGKRIGRWVEPQSFLEDLQAIGQTSQVGISRSVTLQDTIDFLLDLLIPVRMLAE
jgi:hypothetical protein